jgi:hypothetical protein
MSTTAPIKSGREVLSDGAQEALVPLVLLNVPQIRQVLAG